MEFNMKAITTLAALVAFTFSSLTFASPVNINTANAEQIAEALYRTSNGPFSSAEQVIMVRGIGDSTFERNKADILLK